MTSSIPSHPLPSGHHLTTPIPDYHRPGIISPGLYLSSRKPTQDPSMLSQIGITAVLSILTAREALELHLHPNQAPDPSPSSPDSPPAPRRRWIEMRDSRRANLLVRLGDACDFIDAEVAAAATTTITTATVAAGADEERRRESGKVLVHCWAGRSRSATVVAAYLMRRMRWTAAQALRHVTAARPDVRPNPGFVRQLEVWEACGYDIWEAYGYDVWGAYEYDIWDEEEEEGDGVSGRVPKPAYAAWLNENGEHGGLQQDRLARCKDEMDKEKLRIKDQRRKGAWEEHAGGFYEEMERIDRAPQFWD